MQEEAGMHRLLAEAREAAKNWEENTHKSARELEILRGEAEGTVSMLRARLAQAEQKARLDLDQASLSLGAHVRKAQKALHLCQTELNDALNAQQGADWIAHQCELLR